MKKLICIFAAVAVLVSCGTSRYVSGVPAGSAAPAALIEPLSYLTYIQSTGEESFDPEGSEKAQKLLADAVSGAYPGLGGVLPVTDFDNPDELLNCIEALAQINNPKGLEQSSVPEPVRKLLLANGYRYGLLVYSTGFTRDMKNYARAVAGNAVLAIVTAVLTLGMVSVYGIAIPYSSKVCLMVVDAQENRILYFDSTSGEMNPLEAKHVNKQIEKLLKNFE